MQFKLFLITGLCLFNTVAFASYTFESHEWKGAHCSSWGDSSYYGTFNYKFDLKNSISTFIEPHTDHTCSVSTNTKQPQAYGSYLIKNVTESANETSYELQVQYTHLNYPLYFYITVNENEMILCRQKNSSCNKYVKVL